MSQFKKKCHSLSEILTLVFRHKKLKLILHNEIKEIHTTIYSTLWNQYQYKLLYKTKYIMSNMLFMNVIFHYQNKLHLKLSNAFWIKESPKKKKKQTKWEEEIFCLLFAWCSCLLNYVVSSKFSTEWVVIRTNIYVFVYTSSLWSFYQQPLCSYGFTSNLISSLLRHTYTM